MSKDIIVSNLKDCPEYFSQCVSLIERSFGYSRGNSFIVDFHPLMKKENHNNLHIIIKGEKVVAHIGTLSRDITVSGRTFPVLLIGGVCTDELERGNGHFVRLISEVLARNEGYLCYMLWSSLDIFYKKYDFHQVGVVDVVDGRTIGRSNIGSEFVKVDQGNLSSEDIGDLSSLYNAHSNSLIAVRRDTDIWNELCNISSTNLYIKRNDKGRIVGYFFKGKGQDLSGIIHEIFWEDDSYHLSDSLVWLPGDLFPNIDKVNSMYSCLMRIGNHDIFSEFILALSGGAILVENIDGDKVNFRFDGVLNTLSQEDFLQGVLGPGVIEEFRPFYKPLWIGGLDSI